jgi:hypothetical protein
MSTCQPRRVTRTSAEQTIARLARGASHRDEPVAELLAGLVAPTLDRETHGERQALSALRTARQSPIAARRTRTLGRRVRQLVTIKVAVAAAVLAGSGIAVAAGSGELSRALNGGTVSSASRPAAPARAPGLPDYSASRSASHNAAPPNLNPTPRASTPAQAPTARCQVFNALNSNAQRKALRGPAFADLIQAAHGRNYVAAFCAALLAGGAAEPHSAPGSPAVPSQPEHPSHPAHPSRPDHSNQLVHPNGSAHSNRAHS